MIRSVILVLATIAALLFGTPSESHAADRTAFTHTAPTMVTKQAVREPYMMRMVNCEDYDIQPCYTWDEGAWRMVVSYSPYKAVKLAKCKAEDGGPVLPCIWKHNNKVKKGQPVTRNVFTKNG